MPPHTDTPTRRPDGGAAPAGANDLLDAAGVALVVLDDALRITRFTPELGARFGLSPADLGRPLGALGRPLGYDAFADDARGVLASGAGAEREEEAEDGTCYVVRLTPYRPEGARAGVVATFLDVTRRRQAEETATRREGRLRRVIEEAPIPVFLHDEDGRILQISRAVTAITGYTAEELPTREAWMERAYGANRAHVEEALARLYEHGEPVEAREFHVRTKAGEERVWQFSTALLGDDGRGHRLAISMAADVTERKRAEAERAARARQQHAVAELGLEALRCDDLQALFERAVRVVQDTLGTDATKVLELAPDGDHFRLRAGVGWPEDLERPVTVPNDARSQAGYTLTVEHAVTVADAASEARFSRPALLARCGLESGMSVVIGSPERPFGVLGTHARAPRTYTEADADFLQAVANVLGSALQRETAQHQLREANARLAAANETLEQRVEERAASLRESEARLRTLYEVITRPAPSAGAQIDTALAAATALLGFDLGVLSRVEGATYTVEACYAPGSELAPGQAFPLGDSCCARTLALDVPLAVEHLSASEYAAGSDEACPPVESYLGVAVRVDGVPFGTLFFSSPEPRAEPIAEAEREFVALLGQWIGVALAHERAGLQLAESEHLLAGVLLGSQDGIVAMRPVRDEAGRIADFTWILVNPAAAELLRRPAAELLGASYVESFPHTVPTGLFDALAGAVEREEPLQREVHYDADGLRGWFALSVVPLGDGVAMTFRDITERKRTEEALRESEARFRGLFESSPDAIFVEDLGGVVLDVNPAACRLHRADREWLLGRSVSDLVPAEHRGRVEEDFARLAEGHAAPLESYSLTRDGAAIPVEVRADRITYGGGRAVLLHVRDITARRAAEQALKESEERFAKAFHAAPVAFLIATLAEGRFVDVNESFCRLTGYGRAEALGRTYRDLGLVAQASGPALGLRRLRQDGELRELELQVRTRGGAVRDVVVSAERLTLGGVPCVLGIGFDVTERKRLEREVIQATELERRRIGQDLHDELGQQLTGAAFLGKVLQQKLEAREVPEATDAAQLLDLITSALAETRDFSRLLSPVDIQAEGLMDALQDLADQTERVFEVSCLFDMEGDVRIRDNTVATHLFRIAQEAVNNALKHAAPSAVVIHLTRTPHGLRLTVEDDGSGFDPEHVNARAGLGLRTMHYRATLIGAHLAIERGVRGTRVTARLPCES
jgi:PAS domain S-box-containing protein